MRLLTALVVALLTAATLSPPVAYAQDSEGSTSDVCIIAGTPVPSSLAANECAVLDAGASGDLFSGAIDPCSVDAIVCSENHVVAISLIDVGEDQVLIERLDELPELRALALNETRTTLLPLTLVDLGLVYLSLDQVELSNLGSYPFDQLDDLVELHIGGSMPIASTALQLDSLESLTIDAEMLTADAIANADLPALHTLTIRGTSDLDQVLALAAAAPNLEELTLHTGDLQEVPAGLSQLTKLTELHLYGSFTSVTPELFELVQLKSLTLQSRELTSLPDQIGDLRLLERLTLETSRVTSLPASIGQLTQLQELSVTDSALTGLPREIGDLEQLRRLDLEQGNIETLPAEIGNLKQLELLDLTNNELVGLPETLGEATSLRAIGLAQNPITSLPASLTQLDALELVFIEPDRAGLVPIGVTATIGNSTTLARIIDPIDYAPWGAFIVSLLQAHPVGAATDPVTLLAAPQLGIAQTSSAPEFDDGGPFGFGLAIEVASDSAPTAAETQSSGSADESLTAEHDASPPLAATGTHAVAAGTLAVALLACGGICAVAARRDR